MDVERDGDGRWHFALGVIERWVAGIVVAVLGYFLFTFAQNSKEQTDRLAKVETQQAVTNQQLATLTLQLADVPSMSGRVSKNEVRLENVEEQIRELRQMRGLK